jgi:hypothetical protein
MARKPRAVALPVRSAALQLASVDLIDGTAFNEHFQPPVDAAGDSIRSLFSKYVASSGSALRASWIMAAGVRPIPLRRNTGHASTCLRSSAGEVWSMQDMRAQVEKLHVQIAECELIRDLATDPKKRELFTRLAEHFKVLVADIEKVMAAAPPARPQ